MINEEMPHAPEPESRFFEPTVLCPFPERWTSTDGDSTEIEVSDFAYGLVRALQPRYCVETGSGFGQTSARISAAIVANGHGFLTTIENDPERIAALRETLRDSVEVVCADSLTWKPRNGSVIDFAWFDSWYEFRVAEFRRYQPWMRAGTIVCFHDTAPERGAHRIVSGRDLRSEIEAELGQIVRTVHLPTPRGLTIAEVR